MTSRLPASTSVALCVAASSADPQGVPSATPSTRTPGAATAVDPCSLLTAAEVSAATGGTVAEGKAENATGPLGGKRCNWSDDGAQVIDFEVTVQTNADIAVPGQTVDSQAATWSPRSPISEALPIRVRSTRP